MFVVTVLKFLLLCLEELKRFRANFKSASSRVMVKNRIFGGSERGEDGYAPMVPARAALLSHDLITLLPYN